MSDLYNIDVLVTDLRFKVDEELLKMIHNMQDLGSSATLLLSAKDVRTQFLAAGRIFRENAAILFPLDVGSQTQRRRTHKRESKKQPANLDHIVVELPNDLRKLARELIEFQHRVERVDLERALAPSITDFSNNLRYWASCLDDFKGEKMSLLSQSHHLFYILKYEADLKSSTIRYHINDLAAEMDHDLESMTKALKTFVRTGKCDGSQENTFLMMYLSFYSDTSP